MATDLQTREDGSDVVERDPPPTRGIVERPANAVNPFGSPGGSYRESGNALGAAMESRAVAEIQTQFLMAERFRRDERGACDRIVNAFGRPGLAEDAEYEYSRGGSKIAGPSIRAAEAIAQQWGNFDFGFAELGRYRDVDGVGVSSVRARAIDLQTRVVRTIEFQVRHWRDTKSGGYPVTDERDIYEVTANQAQRRVRACILALIPGDVVAMAMTQATTTLRSKADTTPAGIAKLVEAFAPFGVTKKHLEARSQRRIDTISPGQIVTLKRIYASLRDEMSTPGDWFDLAEPGDAGGQPGGMTSALERRRAAREGGNAPAPKPAARSRSKTPAPPPPATASQAQEPAVLDDEAQTVTDTGVQYAYVADKIEKAEDVDALDLAGDLIGEVANEQHRTELQAMYREKRSRLTGEEG